MKNIKKTMQLLWKDESAQGATEYILILAVIVGLVMLFGDKIKGVLGGKIETLSSEIQRVGQ